MQILFDAPEVKREIIRLLTFAQANPLDLRKGIPKNHTPAGDNPKHVFVNGNIKIVYSVEIQPAIDPKGMYCHHLSVSKLPQQQTPDPIIVSEIMSQLGMGTLKEKKQKHIYLEGGAINVIQPFTYT